MIKHRASTRADRTIGWHRQLRIRLRLHVQYGSSWYSCKYWQWSILAATSIYQTVCCPIDCRLGALPTQLARKFNGEVCRATNSSIPRVMRRDAFLPSPESETISNRDQWRATRLLLVATWVSCCVLLVLLLLGEVQFLPSMKNQLHKAVLPVDFKVSTRYLRQSTTTSSTTLTTVLDAAVQNRTATNESAAKSLESLWQELRFTPVLETAETRNEYQVHLQDTLYQQATAQLTSAATASTAQEPPILAPLFVPQISEAQHPELVTLLQYAKDAIESSITAKEARSAYIAALDTTEPPYADGAWHVGVSQAAWQQQQHIGAAFEETTAESISSPISNSGTAWPSELAQQDDQQLPQYPSRTHNATLAAQQLMTQGLTLLKASQRLAHCGTDDSSMPQQEDGNRILLAAVLSDSDNEASSMLGAASLPRTAVDAVANSILQVIMFAVQSQPGSLFVSIVHDSSSSREAGEGTDSAEGSGNVSNDLSYWIDVLKLLLLPLRVPLLVTDAAGWQQHSHAGAQSSTMQQQAAMRNLAINNFFSLQGAAPQDHNCSSSSSHRAPVSTDDVGSSNNSSDSSSRRDGSRHNGTSAGVLQLARCFQPDTVLFVDSDVLFCRADLQRLLLHKQADVACGFDLRMAESAAAAAAAPAPARGSVQTETAGGSVQTVAASAANATSSALVAEAGTTTTAAGGWQRQLLQQESVDFGVLHVEQIQQQQHQPAAADSSQDSSTGPAAHRQLLQQQQFMLRSVPGRPPLSTLAQHPYYYGDAAVARLAGGDMFDVLPPYISSDRVTQSRLAAGVPVQVYCCWSGLAKVNAAPFRQGLRFRSHQPAECNSTPANLLCDDLHRLGHSKVLIDSGVLVTRQLPLSARISNSVKHAQRMPYIRRSRWLEVQAAGSPWLIDQHQLQEHTYKSVICCEDGDTPHKDAQPQDSRISGTSTGRRLKGLWGLSLSSSSSSEADVRQPPEGYAPAAGFGGFSEDVAGGFSSRGSWGAEGTNESGAEPTPPAAAAADPPPPAAPAAVPLYPAAPLTLEEYLAASAALPVGKTGAVRVAAAVRWRASMKAGVGAAAAVAAAGSGVQQCRLVDVMERNYTEGYLWQVKQAQQQQQSTR